MVYRLTEEMKDFCFFTCCDYVYKDVCDGLVRSIKRFYPEADVLVFDVPRSQDGSGFNLQEFCNFHLERGKELLDSYRRIISVDTDHIMCNFCPDLFDNYDFGFVQNNIPVGSAYGGVDTDIYINAGLTVCTKKDVWLEWMNEYYRLCNNRWEELNEQNSLNWIYHNRKHEFNFKLLEFKDKSYGISDNFIYKDMYLDKGELTLTNGKKVRMFHAAGTEWKVKATGAISFDLIVYEPAREKIKLLIQ